MAPTRSATTRERLLTAAETLFLSDGFETVSVRAICSAAGANPAAVHYHFGTRDDLVTALLEHRLGPIWADPLNRLDPSTTSIAAIVELIIDPLVRLQADPTGHLHLRLLTRFVDDHPEAGWSRPWFRLDDWTDLLLAITPGLDARAARQRWALAFTLILTRFGGSRPLSPGAVTALAGFVVAGLGAPIEETS
ncbi:TetR/AcrR family transcriptional regulator [Gordonia sp. NPDC003950]